MKKKNQFDIIINYFVHMIFTACTCNECVKEGEYHGNNFMLYEPLLCSGAAIISPHLLEWGVSTLGQ